MYCPFCGARLSAQTQYCNSCGNAVGNQISIQQHREAVDIARYIVGGVFLLLGFLPYLVGFFLDGQSTVLQTIGLTYGSQGVIAVNYLSTFTSLISPLFLFVSSAVTVFTGATLLQKHRTGKQSLIMCIVLHAAALVYSGIIQLVLYAAPAAVLSLFTNDLHVIEAGAKIFESVMDPFADFCSILWIRAGISVVSIAGCIVLLALGRTKPGVLRVKRPGNSATGILLTFLSIAVLWNLSNLLSSSLLAPYGKAVVASFSVARNIFTQYCQLFCLAALFGCIALAVRVKKENWIVRLCVAVTVAVAGLVMILFSPQLVAEQHLPKEMQPFAPRQLRLLVVNGMCMLIALMFWLQAVAQNRMGKCAQVMVPVSLPFIYWLFRILTNLLMPSLNDTLAMVIVAIVLTGSAFLFSHSNRTTQGSPL